MPSGSDLLGDVLARLVKGGFVARGDKGQWLLARDLETATLHDLFVCLDLTLGPTDMRGNDRQPWHDRLDALLGAADRTNRERFSVSSQDPVGPGRRGHRARGSPGDRRDRRLERPEAAQ